MINKNILCALGVLTSVIMISGCDNSASTETEAHSICTTSQPTTISTTETVLNIESEYEFVGSETKGLIMIFGLSTTITSSEAVISFDIDSIRISRANVDVKVELYDSTESLIDTLDRDYILDSSQVISSKNIIIKYFGDNVLQITKCKLFIKAKE